MPTNPIKPRDGFKVASAVFGDPLKTIDCLVKLEGTQHALVELSKADRIPDRFLLIATSIQIRRDCQVIEREADWLRVTFAIE
jgi:hypothetical protein